MPQIPERALSVLAPITLARSTAALHRQVDAPAARSCLLNARIFRSFRVAPVRAARRNHVCYRERRLISQSEAARSATAGSHAGDVCIYSTGREGGREMINGSKRLERRMRRDWSNRSNVDVSTVYIRRAIKCKSDFPITRKDPSFVEPGNLLWESAAQYTSGNVIEGLDRTRDYSSRRVRLLRVSRDYLGFAVLNHANTASYLVHRFCPFPRISGNIASVFFESFLASCASARRFPTCNSRFRNVVSYENHRDTLKRMSKSYSLLRSNGERRVLSIYWYIMYICISYRKM